MPWPAPSEGTVRLTSDPQSAAHPRWPCPATWVWACGLAFPVVCQAQPLLGATLVGAGGGLALAAQWRNRPPRLRAAAPYACILAPAVPACLLAGGDSWLLAAWAFGVLCAGLAAEEWCGDAAWAARLAIGLRAAAIAAAAAVVGRYTFVGPFGDTWYRQLAEGDLPWSVPPLATPTVAMGLLAAGLPHSVTRIRGPSGRVAAVLEAALVTGALLIVSKPVGACVAAIVAGLLTHSGAGTLGGVATEVAPTVRPWTRLGALPLALLLVGMGFLGAGVYAKRDALRYRLRAPALVARESVVERAYAWRTALRMVSAHPIGDAGLGRFADLYGSSRPGNATEAYQAVRRPVSPRNDVLLAAAELGVPGAVIGLWLALSAVTTRRRQMAPCRADTFRASVVAVAFAAVTEGCLFSPPCLLAMVASIGALRARPNDTTPTSSPRPSQWPALSALALAVAAALAPLAVPRVPHPVPAITDDNDPAALVVLAQSEPPIPASERRALVRRALILFPAVREAAARNPAAMADTRALLAGEHARAADLLADLYERDGCREAATALHDLGRQILAAAQAP